MTTDLRGRDIIDSRDVIARLEELEARVSQENHGPVLDDFEWEELQSLRSLVEEAEGYATDWLHGVTLVADDHFEDYARQLAQDIGAISADWPACHVDWEGAAVALKMDYVPVGFDGKTYWVR